MYIYKSTSSTEYNTNLLIEMLKKAVDKHGISHLLIFGDFNFPEIDWMNCLIKGSDRSLPANFFDITQDLFIKQHVDFKGALYRIQILCRRYAFWSYPAGLTIAYTPE